MGLMPTSPYISPTSPLLYVSLILLPRYLPGTRRASSSPSCAHACSTGRGSRGLVRGVGPTGRSRGVGQPGPNAAGVSYEGWTGTIGTRQVWLACIPRNPGAFLFPLPKLQYCRNFAKVARAATIAPGRPQWIRSVDRPAPTLDDPDGINPYSHCSARPSRLGTSAP